MSKIEKSLSETLQHRKELALFRSLRTSDNLVDFCSNDYLGLAHSAELREAVKIELKGDNYLNGATGSRLLAGNTVYVEELEQEIADFHHAESGLIFNSGYDANIGLLASLPQKNDILLTDELIHASMIDGARLSYANRYKFRHNDVADLVKKLEHLQQNLAPEGHIFVGIESVYSMDGDTAKLVEIVEICEQFGANLIVDEAHATGVFGKDGKGLVCQLGLQDRVFARIITFGKALGSHGAIILGSRTLRDYLINFARSFIYSTAAPLHTHAGIKCAYQYLKSPEFGNEPLHELIAFFRENAESQKTWEWIPSVSAIQCIIIPGNENVRKIAGKLQAQGLDIRPIVSPTVPKGRERLRICLHTFNTKEEITAIFKTLSHTEF